ncbi:type II toxin-antitoxin system PemK/MazF family toxin [Methanoplanus limicola]|uniref:Transcriptional modulator of MazE/toxin, MazF n=1 Tax=Methanoplanus limicola DSM 2279 TaxID=937775 RepID=H1YXL4_9EURY|nr:type II toxin-antitoxin system PemK/MazF family toxin [Methanoplanus limicola]EHQ34983.1 hypothetical protein Metlim_0861 [Methanoplanus limicola DSM 2279]
MPAYRKGDVVLATVGMNGRWPDKVRPAVIIRDSGGKDVELCPVTSRIPNSGNFIPVELYDFESGGLDMFSESYILLSEKRTIKKREIVCRKGRLSKEFILEITAAFSS